jgi:hypothetical protein
MLQDETSVGLDPVSLPRPLSPALRIYVLFLFVAVMVTVTELVALWIAAPPFRRSRQANDAGYLQRLRTARASVKQWMGFTLLGWCFVASVDLYRISGRLLAAKTSSAISILWAIRDFSVGPELAFLVALFLFVVQWHLHDRITRLNR